MRYCIPLARENDEKVVGQSGHEETETEAEDEVEVGMSSRHPSPLQILAHCLSEAKPEQPLSHQQVLRQELERKQADQ